MEDETPAGPSADAEGPDHAEEIEASEEALAFMSSIGE